MTRGGEVEWLQCWLTASAMGDGARPCCSSSSPSSSTSSRGTTASLTFLPFLFPATLPFFLRGMEKEGRKETTAAETSAQGAGQRELNDDERRAERGRRGDARSERGG